ncbi:uncharacterized protein LOC106476462 [Limulus polyphemus]|uniref:Uncharacterized protein LOC106476462 n=1 Tax=Limulus polyphemus TaxID=6850 RepID=A0ABM1RXD0_LIMPO|nr:uncharacterized protein LOC106476462 [Limulus polyphemus]
MTAEVEPTLWCGYIIIINKLERSSKALSYFASSRVCPQVLGTDGYDRIALSNTEHSSQMYRSENFAFKEKIQFGIVLTRVIVVIITHIIASIAAGLSSLDLRFCALPVDGSEPKKIQENDGIKPGSARNSTRQTMQLPEARIHVQEAPGTGEELTVVTLPVQEGFVYAVPEDQYVIRRLEGTYVAPSTNPYLASFFPSYTKINVE